MATTDETRHKRIQRLIGVGLVAATVIVVAPLIYTLIEGLAGLALAAVIGAAIIQFAPVVSMKFANWKLKGMKAEAKKNPIETMQNNLNADRERFELAEKGFRVFRGKVRTLKSRVEASRSKVSAAGLKPMEDALAGMQALLEQREAKLRAASHAIELKQKNIEEKRILWDLSLAAEDAVMHSGGHADALAAITNTEADNAVDERVNLALGDLDDELFELGAQAQLENNPSDVIDMDSALIEEGQPVRVRR